MIFKKPQKQFDYFVLALKIVLIVYFITASLSYVHPYYQCTDCYVFALEAINISNGKYDYTNELLSETGLWEFVPAQYVKTIYNTAVPVFMPGWPALLSIFYLVGGFVGLFWAGLFFSVLLLIVTERLASKILGKLGGLITLVLMVSTYRIMFWGWDIMSEGVFSLFFICGVYFLVEFSISKKSKNLLFASSLFVVCSLLRINGIIFLLIPIAALLFYFIYQKLSSFNILTHQHSDSTLLLKMKTSWMKEFLFILIPISFFLTFFFSFNTYYFGDPFTYYENVPKPYDDPFFDRGSPTTFFDLNEDRYEKLKFLGYFMVPTTWITLFEQVWKNGAVFLIHILLIPSLIIAIRNKRHDILILISFIYLHLFIFTSDYIVSYKPYGFAIRYHTYLYGPIFMIISFLILSPFNWSSKLKKSNFRKIIKILIIIIVFFLLALQLITFVTDPLVNKIGTQINSPFEYYDLRYPYVNEDIPSNGVIVNRLSTLTIDRGHIPFAPYNGLDTKSGLPKDLNEHSIEILERTIAEGYPVFVYKKHASGHKVNHEFFGRLATEYNFVFFDHSPTFCKVSLKNGIINEIIKENFISSPMIFGIEENNQNTKHIDYIDLTEKLPHESYTMRIFYEDTVSTKVMVTLLVMDSKTNLIKETTTFEFYTQNTHDLHSQFKFDINTKEILESDKIYIKIESDENNPIMINKLVYHENTKNRLSDGECIPNYYYQKQFELVD